jgi:hypothetical protein
VAYWYQTEPHAPLPEVPRITERRWPEVEPEARFEARGVILVHPGPQDALAHDGTLEARRHDALLFPVGRTLRLRALRRGASVSLPIEIREAGPYDLFAELVLTPECGIFEGRLDGRLLFGGVDGYAARESASREVYLGRTDLSSGHHVLEFASTGRSMYATGYDLEISRLRLQRLR